MSLLVHAALVPLVFFFLLLFFTLFPQLDPAERRPVRLVIQPPAPKEQVQPEVPEPQYDDRGQIVQLAPPRVEEVPDEADYRAEFDARTERETRTERFEVNPEVLSREYSREQRSEQAEAFDLNVDKPSTGATIGNQRFDPDRDGSMAALPSPWKMTNKPGEESPIPSAQRTAALAGAPQNDLLREEIGKYIDLNTARHPYAGYIQRILRQVNFWWEQNVDSLPASVRYARSTTVVSIVLDARGELVRIEVVRPSGTDLLDDCVVRAFKYAAPFDNPPTGLLKSDGRVHLDNLAFTVPPRADGLHFQGVDPRAGVQFPGILKSPR